MLKLYCNKCHGFMKELRPDETKHLQGNEICKDCEESARTALNEFNKKATKIISDLQSRHNKGVTELETLIRTVFDE